MKVITVLCALLFAAHAQANDSCKRIVSRTVQASFASQEEYKVTSQPRLVSETDPRTGLDIFDTWLVRANEQSEEGGFSITVLTSRRPGDSLAKGCKILGIY